MATIETIRKILKRRKRIAISVYVIVSNNDIAKINLRIG